MPEIPIIQDSANLDTRTARRQVQAGPDAFGGQEARALAGVAQTLDRAAGVADAKLNEFAEAEARDYDNQFQRALNDRLTNTETGYLSTTRERAALDQRQQAESDIDALAVYFAGRIQNQRSRAMFEDVARRRVSAALGQIASHASTQNTAYLDRQLQIQQSQATEAAVAMAHDPVEVTNQFSTMNAALARRRQMFGWGDEEYAAIEGAARSDFYSGVIVALAADDPERAQTLYESVAPELRAEDRVQLYNTMRAAIRASEDAVIDEAWTFVAGGQRIPSALWQRVPGRARIDIQNEIRRRAEGGAGTGETTLYNDLRVMAMDDPSSFAIADLRVMRGRLGDQNYLRLREMQENMRTGAEPTDVVQQRTAFNAIRDIAATTLGLDFTPTENTDADDRQRAEAFNAALLNEVDAFQRANPGAPIDGETSQILIGRAWVSMRGEDVTRETGRVRGVRGRSAPREGNRGTAVASVTEVVVPFASMPPAARQAITTRLQSRLGRMPTQGEVENEYARFLTARR